MIKKAKKKVGQYLIEDLQQSGLLNLDISDMFQYVLDNPVYKGSNPKYKDFKLSAEAEKVFNYYSEKYLYLTPDSETLKEAVIFNAPIEKSVINAIKILVEGKEEHLVALKAFQQNLKVEKTVLNIEDDTIFKRGTWYKTLTVAFKKQF